MQQNDFRLVFELGARKADITALVPHDDKPVMAQVTPVLYVARHRAPFNQYTPFRIGIRISDQDSITSALVTVRNEYNIFDLWRALHLIDALPIITYDLLHAAVILGIGREPTEEDDPNDPDGLIQQLAAAISTFEPYVSDIRLLRAASLVMAIPSNDVEILATNCAAGTGWYKRVLIPENAILNEATAGRLDPEKHPALQQILEDETKKKAWDAYYRGVSEVPLPPGQSISRFLLQLDGLSIYNYHPDPIMGISLCDLSKYDQEIVYSGLPFGSAKAIVASLDGKVGCLSFRLETGELVDVTDFCFCFPYTYVRYNKSNEVIGISERFDDFLKRKPVFSHISPSFYELYDAAATQSES